MIIIIIDDDDDDDDDVMLMITIDDDNWWLMIDVSWILHASKVLFCLSSVTVLLAIALGPCHYISQVVAPWK